MIGGWALRTLGASSTALVMSVVALIGHVHRASADTLYLPLAELRWTPHGPSPLVLQGGVGGGAQDAIAGPDGLYVAIGPRVVLFRVAEAAGESRLVPVASSRPLPGVISDLDLHDQTLYAGWGDPYEMASGGVWALKDFAADSPAFRVAGALSLDSPAQAVAAVDGAVAVWPLDCYCIRVAHIDGAGRPHWTGELYGLRPLGLAPLGGSLVSDGRSVIDLAEPGRPFVDSTLQAPGDPSRDGNVMATLDRDEGTVSLYGALEPTRYELVDSIALPPSADWAMTSASAATDHPDIGHGGVVATAGDRVMWSPLDDEARLTSWYDVRLPPDWRGTSVARAGAGLVATSGDPYWGAWSTLQLESNQRPGVALLRFAGSGIAPPEHVWHGWDPNVSAVAWDGSADFQGGARAATEIVYAATESGLDVYDATSPAGWELLGHWTGSVPLLDSQFGAGLAIDGEGGLVASSDTEAAIFDISDSVRPSLVRRGPALGRLLSRTHAHLLAVQGNELVAFDYDSGAEWPREVGRVTVAHGLDRIVLGPGETISDRMTFALAMLGHGEGLVWFGESDSSGVRIGDRLQAGVEPSSVCLSERYAYWLRLVDDQVRFEAIDTSDAPLVTLDHVAGSTLVGQPGHVLGGSGWITGAACDADRVFLASDTGVHTFSVSDPRHPRYVGTTKWSSWWQPFFSLEEWDSWTALWTSRGSVTAVIPGVGAEVWRLR